MVTRFYVLVLAAVSISLVNTEKSKCAVCKDLTTHFKKYFDETSGQNYGGGNTAWEEKSLGSYATSETRLVEMLEKSSKDCDYKCSSLLEDQEEFLEEWFFKKQKSHPDVHKLLCIETLQRCCPDNTFGKECQECPGGTTKPCSGHGSCEGAGDREGKGTCNCDMGYNGTTCDTCKDMFIRNAENNECESCSSLCEGQCVGIGPKGCTQCIKGYELDETEGCKDIDECTKEGMGCGDPLEDCVNSPGTFECVCKAGYHRVQGKCQLEDLYADENETDDGGEESLGEGGDTSEENADTSPSSVHHEDGMEGDEVQPDVVEKDASGASSLAEAFERVKEQYDEVSRENLEEFKEREGLQDFDIKVGSKDEL